MLIDRLTSAVADFSIRRPILALSLSIATCLLLAIPALGIRLDTDIYRLLPDDSPAVKSFREMVAQFGATDQLFVAVEAPVGADGLVAAEDLARAAAATDRIADGLA
nr:hypothetical protein [Planctomycetota bacterium]